MTERTLDKAALDIGILLAQIDFLQEVLEESLEAEDAALVAQIRADWIDAHTAAQPAPDAVAEARPNRCYPEHYASGWQCASCGASWKEDGPDECPLEPLA